MRNENHPTVHGLEYCRIPASAGTAEVSRVSRWRVGWAVCASASGAPCWRRVNGESLWGSAGVHSGGFRLRVTVAPGRGGIEDWANARRDLSWHTGEWRVRHICT